MNENHLKKISKRLSLHLRHAPERIGIALDPHGWVEVDVLLAALRRHGLALSREKLADVVEHNDKRRFSFDETGDRFWLAERVPPEFLRFPAPML